MPDKVNNAGAPECPYCGCENQVPDEKESDDSYTVECTGCGALFQCSEDTNLIYVTSPREGSHPDGRLTFTCRVQVDLRPYWCEDDVSLPLNAMLAKAADRAVDDLNGLLSTVNADASAQITSHEPKTATLDPMMESN